MDNKKSFLQYTFVVAIFVILILLALIYTIPEPQYEKILSSNLIFTAFKNTLLISFISLFGALIFGFILFVMMRSNVIVLRAISKTFNEIIMGTPLLVLIFLVVFVLGLSINYNNKFVLGIISLIIYNAPYIANAYETTAAVVDKEQYVVMDLYNFNSRQKYFYVIVPQMIKPFIPSLVNNLSSVIKSSSLLNIIAVTEITYLITSLASRNFAFIEGYYVMWIMYLIVTIPLSLLAKGITKYIVK